MRRLMICLLGLSVFLFCFNTSSFAAASASFVGTDMTTQGNWMATYGTVGYYIPSGPSATPSDGSSFSPGAASLWKWGTDVASTGALKTGTTTNIASAWYGATLVLDVKIPAGQSQTVAVYVQDYSQQGRAESVSITDPNNSNAALGSPFAVSDFVNGEYLVYTITGEVDINITLVSGPNAVANGIFFGVNSNMPPPVVPDLASLAARVAKLEGQIVTSDLVGTYQLFGIQNELNATNQSVGAYVYNGMFILNADGSGSTTVVTQTGQYLYIGDKTMLYPANNGPSTATFNWTYSNTTGLVTLSGSTNPQLDGGFFNVAVGGRVMTHAGANSSDGTDVLLIATRLK